MVINMTKIRKISKQDIINGITSDSSAHGYGYGEPARLPVVENSSVIYEESCDNNSCHGKCVIFKHIVNIYEDSKYGSDIEFMFEWDANIETIKLEGEVCPICDRTYIYMPMGNLYIRMKVDLEVKIVFFVYRV